MKTSTIVKIAAALLIATAVILAFVLPGGILPQRVKAIPDGGGGGAPVELAGVIRDFRENHPDFMITPTGGHGHYAGNVQLALGADGVPVFAGRLSESETFDEFEIELSEIVPEKPFAAMVTVIGAQIQSGEQFLPVTTRITIGNDVITPFGPYDRPRVGNVNLGELPRRYIIPTQYAAWTPITVEGASWEFNGDGSRDEDYRPLMAFDTDTNTPMIKVLRDGDPVPEIPGFQDQASIVEFLGDYVEADGEIKLHEHQAICLFELGESDLSSPAADFQDLVLLITLAHSPEQLTLYDVVGNLIYDVEDDERLGYRVDAQWQDADGNPIAPHLYEQVRGDHAGVRGVASSGGIRSMATFRQWFVDALGINLSERHTIVLDDVGGGVYEFTADEFHPIDGVLLGNDGHDHNTCFTWSFVGSFTYEADSAQFFEFDGADDAWLFVDGKLALDRGGIVPPVRQRAFMDRMGLNDGASYDVRFFFAQRQSLDTYFRIRTNMFTSGEEDASDFTVTGGYD